MVKKTKKAAKKLEAVPLKLDIGCGSNKKQGFYGVDIVALPGVDLVADLTEGWPWPDNSVDEIHCSHFLEHLTNLDGKFERVKFFNEAYRVMKPGAKMTIVVPCWSADRFYGDPTHKEPLSGWTFLYLKPEWRAANAPHTDARWVPGMYDCDLDASWGYSLHPQVSGMNPERQQYAISFYKEACQDMIATVVKPAAKEDPK